jgi:2-keto-4-pentenoate hydratase/2-oxohepta-3-ene-1,7-dioic acid hydratase in catechol pathway
VKLIQFESPEFSGWGILDGLNVRALPYIAFDRPLPEAMRSIQASSVRRLLAPASPPRNVFCLGRNYAEHVKEGPGATAGLPTKPVWFTKATSSVNHPEGEVVVDPGLTTQLDWEVELAVVLSQGGRRIAEDRALDHVFGYTVLNDITARDIQNGRSGQWFLGKSLDTTCPIGPCLVTRDEIPDPQNLELTLRVNGAARQSGHTRDMIFSVAHAIADLSNHITLQPGDVIATGTPSGTGMGMSPQLWLQDGDVVEAEISGIGTLRNTIVFRPSF